MNTKKESITFTDHLLILVLTKVPAEGKVASPAKIPCRPIAFKGHAFSDGKNEGAGRPADDRIEEKGVKMPGPVHRRD